MGSLQARRRATVRLTLRSRALLLAALTTGPAAAMEVALLSPPDGQWTGTADPVVLRIDREADDADGRLAIFIGNNDVTRLFRRQRGGEYRFSPRLLRLPRGEQEIRVYLVTSAQDWKEVARLPIRVLQPGGFERTALTPRFDLTQKSQFDEGHSADVPEPPRRTYYDWASQAGLATMVARGNWEFTTSWNFVGSSVQEEALRFSERGENAPKVDMSDYLAEFRLGSGKVSVGHVSYGDHPLVLSGLSHRGLNYRQQLGSRLDFGVTAQGGQYITGYSDLLGKIDSDNYIGAASFGFEFLRNRPGGLRLDAIVLDSERVSDLDFNTGQVPDAEDNTAFGFRLSGSTPGGRLRGTVAWARSEYFNPDDPVLAQGSVLVPVEEDEEDARSIDLSLDLIQNRQFGTNSYATLTVGFRHAKSDPLYQTIGAFVSGDQETNAGSLNANIGFFSFQGEYSESEDNVDDIPTILKTETENLSLSYALPLKALVTSGSAWWPETFTQSYFRTHQVGVNLPPSFDPLTHIPDQVSQNHGISLGWNIWRSNIYYSFSLGDQDNKQPGRQNADFKDITHGLGLGLQLSRNLSVNLGASFTEAEDKEQDITRDTDNYTFDLNWQIGRGFAFRGSYTLTESDDSRNISDDRSWTTLTELNWRFEMPWFGRDKAPGQLYVRHSATGNEFSDNLFGFNSYFRSWAWTGGFNISLF